MLPFYVKIKNMTKLQKYLFLIITVLTAVMITICASLYHAIHTEPNEIAINYQMIHDKKIPADMYDVSIAYFTDLEYGTYQDAKRTDALFKKLNDLHPDILIFGGDLFEAEYEPSEEEKNQMIDRLASIDAPLGKFAVLGEQDLTSEERLALVSDVYGRSQIELIDNSNRFVANMSKSGIKLIGLRPEVNYDTALAGVDNSTYNLLISHYADPLCSDVLKNAHVSYALAGNAHGTQIMYPVLGGYKEYEGNTKLNRDKTQNLPFNYLISRGTGCIHVNARLNATPEIVYIIFTR